MKSKKPEYPTPHRIMGEAIKRLRGWPRDVYLLTIRDGKSLKEAAEVLKLEEIDVQRYQNRAVVLVEEYCKHAIAQGRI